MSGTVAAVLGANACFLAAGAGLLRGLGGWRTPRGLLARLGLAYVAGVAAVGVLLQLLLVAGAPFGVPLVLVASGTLTATALLGRAGADATGPRLPPRLLLAPAAVAVGMLALLVVDSVYQPIGAWDAWAQWTAKARALVLFDGLEASLFASDAYRDWNPDYPLLVPALDGADLAFSGGVGTRALALQSWLLLAGFLLAAAELLRDRVRPALVWPTLVLLAVAPAVQIGTAAALADVPLAVFVALAGVCAWRWLESEARLDLALLALLAAAALATKVEGRVFVAALFASIGVALAVTERRRLVPLGVAGAVALVGLVPWSLWAAHHGPTGVVDVTAAGARERLGELDRVPLAVRELGVALVDPSAWLVLLPVAVAAALLAWRAGGDRRAVAVTSATFALSLAGLVLVYWVTPLDPRWHLDRSAHRVVTAPLLQVAVLTPLLLASALAGRARSTL